jgi:hypothetical protein
MEKYRDRLLRAAVKLAERNGADFSVYPVFGTLQFFAEVDAVLEEIAERATAQEYRRSQPSLKGTVAAVEQAFEEHARGLLPPDIGGDVPGGGAV